MNFLFTEAAVGGCGVIDFVLEVIEVVVTDNGKVTRKC
jgi:hypothetical protein